MEPEKSENESKLSIISMANVAIFYLFGVPPLWTLRYQKKKKKHEMEEGDPTFKYKPTQLNFKFEYKA